MFSGIERAQKAKAAAQAKQTKQAFQDAIQQRETTSLQQETDKLNSMWEKFDVRTRERSDEQVRSQLEDNEFSRARLQADVSKPRLNQSSSPHTPRNTGQSRPRSVIEEAQMNSRV